MVTVVEIPEACYSITGPEDNLQYIGMFAMHWNPEKWEPFHLTERTSAVQVDTNVAGEQP